MDKVAQIFNKQFAHWNITLPEESIRLRQRGQICKEGWAIWYLFGKNDQGEYLDYYASNRMTNDRHTRIFSDGKIESLPTMNDWCPSSEDPEENKRLEAEYYAENQKVMKILKDKGFAFSGNESGNIPINMYLKTTKVDDPK